jgi:(1->4)-alpha-D-glucan 1-alpha-D-glucosylmutase
MSDPQFCAAVKEFVDRIAQAGWWNGLAQTLLKIASPGVPDFYQGSEVWDLRLVDPDNREPVDYAVRRCLLQKIARTPLEQLLKSPGDGAIKLLVVRNALHFRRAHHELFEEGRYIPLRAAGEWQDHVVAFARTRAGQTAIAVTGRFLQELPADAWQSTALTLRREVHARSFRDVLTGRTIEVSDGRKPSLPLNEIFATMPVALLVG